MFEHQTISIEFIVAQEFNKYFVNSINNIITSIPEYLCRMKYYKQSPTLLLNLQILSNIKDMNNIAGVSRGIITKKNM